MVVDTLKKRYGNSITMLRLLRDGVFSIVDAHKKSWRTAKRAVRSTNVACDNVDKWGQRKPQPMRLLVAIIEPSMSA